MLKALGLPLLLCLVVLLGAMVAAAAEESCDSAGPQSPRDITQTAGSNPVHFPVAPPASELSLCNIHFHAHAEHKGPGFQELVGDDEFGGFACNAVGAAAESESPPVCGDVSAGDTIEMHWVFTSCQQAEPGPGLRSCTPCDEPVLRVEAQVFEMTDSGGLDFALFALAPERMNGRSQPRSLPDGTEIVSYAGSTTGPEYDDAVCSQARVTWAVRPQCLPLDLHSLGTWCGDNLFDERKPHLVRELVTNPELLSAITSPAAP